MTTGRNPDHLSRNLDALRQHYPALADSVQKVPVPDTATRVAGRDGSRTFLLADASGRRSWFGGSSMPTVSAPAMIDPVEAGTVNVLLPAIATGLEARLLAEKSDPHVAVFVHEPDALALRLALELHDLAALVASGRLVLLSGADIEAALIEFFREHGGYEFPAKIVPLAGLDPGLAGRVKLAVESAGRRVADEQAALVAETSADLRARQGFEITGAPRVAILSVDPRRETLEMAGSVLRAAQKLNWPVACCVPDAPSRCHGLARLQAVHDHQADLVLTLNSFGGRIEPHLSERQPVASWFGPFASVAASLSDRVPSHGLHFVARPEQRVALLEAGLPDDRVRLLETAADDVTFHPLAASDDLDAWRCEVAVLGDVADLDPAAHVSAESHARIFRAIVQSAPTWAETYKPEQADPILARAERRCDRVLKEDRIRTGLIELIRSVIAPTLLSRLAVERLAKAGSVVQVWGRNWVFSKGYGKLLRGPIPPPDDRNRLYNAAGVVLCPYFTASTVQIVLDVLAAGGRVIYRRPHAAIDALHPQTGEVLTQVPAYHRLTELSRCIVRWKAGSDGRADDPADRARGPVLERHTMTSRLESLRAAVADAR